MVQHKTQGWFAQCEIIYLILHKTKFTQHWLAIFIVSKITKG